MGIEGKQRTLPWILVAVLTVVLALAVVGYLWLGWFVSKEIERVRIVLVGVEAEISRGQDLRVLLSCELLNANPEWVKLVTADYCVEVNGEEILCSTFPDAGEAILIQANGTAEAQVVVKPTPMTGVRLLGAVAKVFGLPAMKLVGTARLVESPIGNLEFPFETRRIEFELKHVGVRFDLDLLD